MRCRGARVHARDGGGGAARSDGQCACRSGRCAERRCAVPQQSNISKEVAASIHDLPGIRRNAQGEPIAVSLVGVFVQVRAKADGGVVGFPVLGVTPGLTDLTPELRLTAGRLFQPGLRELIASTSCAKRFDGFNAGDKKPLRGGEWLIVGNFVLGETEGNCVVYGDANTIMSAFGRNTFSQVGVMLQTEASFAELTRAIEADPALHIVARHQAQIAEENNRQLSGILNFVSYFVGTIMALAATIGAANSMYAIVDGRRRELATLRALGFDSGAIVASMLLESIDARAAGRAARRARRVGAVQWISRESARDQPPARRHASARFARAGLGPRDGADQRVAPGRRAARVPVTVGLRAT